MHGNRLENTAGDIVNFDYGYDSNGNITSQTFDHRTADPVNNYTYDDLDRLTQAEYLGDPNDNEVFTYDKLGNRQTLNNRAGQKDRHYLSLVRKITRLETRKVYLLTAWGKGDGTNGIGICSDLHGHQGFHYLPAWRSLKDWQKLEMEFSAPSQNMNLIIRNESELKNLEIDDI